MSTDDRSLTMNEAAAHFRVGRRFFQDFIKAHPHYRIMGRRKLFFSDDIERTKNALARPAGPGATAQKTAARALYILRRHDDRVASAPREAAQCSLTEVWGQAGSILKLQCRTLRKLGTTTLNKGFNVVGEAACASPENFNEYVGRRIARETARQKILAVCSATSCARCSRAARRRIASRARILLRKPYDASR
jgi:N4 Gp49/Sf6 Gp66 family protein